MAVQSLHDDDKKCDNVKLLKNELYFSCCMENNYLESPYFNIEIKKPQAFLKPTAKS
jgi:hypothetical protein